MYASEQSEQQPVSEASAPVNEAPFAPTSTAPPVPAEGLPEGWTMEQWGHYGAQWLEDNASDTDDSTAGGLDFDL